MHVSLFFAVRKSHGGFSADFPKNAKEGGLVHLLKDGALCDKQYDLRSRFAEWRL